MSIFRKLNKYSSSDKQIDISDIRDNILKIEPNKYRMIIKTSSINFELKNDLEQDSIITAYENLLNGLGFNLQILLRTRRLNIDEYLFEINKILNAEVNNIYKKQLEKYITFIKKLVIENKIISKNFYVVVGIENESTDFNLVKEHLKTRTDLVIKALSKIGIHSEILENLEIIDLFYSFYSPTRSKNQPLSNTLLTSLNNVFTGNIK